MVYGATQDEMATAFKIGAVIGGIAALMAWLYFATYSLSALLAMAGGAVVFGGLLSYWTAKAKRGLVRTFRYVHH
ncbi:hypothetical protein BTJ49_14590 [Oleiagrimonas sp. MCCC 1A03011]|nr:hypothetical protein BTJ49_14590 [Oleiagrimonas sp. MCCC 1A03011]